MNNSLVKILSHILDIVDPNWQQNEEIMKSIATLTKLEPKTKRNFERPTLQEVADELRKQKVRGYQAQAERFWNFYESKDWMIGKNKMKNWRAAIRTWNFEKDNIIL